MKCVFAIFVLVICAVNALPPLEAYFDKYVEDKATSLADLKQQIDKLRRTYESHSLYSRYPQHGCLESLAPLEDSTNAYEIMGTLLGFLRQCQPGIVYSGDFGNQLMDTVLTYLRHVIQEKGYSSVALPDFNESGFHGWAGSFENTASVARRSTTQLEMNGTHLILATSLGLDDFRLGYEYEGKVSIFYARGQIRAVVNTNALEFKVDLNLSPANCGFSLNGWALRELGGIDVDINGLGILGIAKGKIVKQLKQAFEAQIRDALEGQVKDTAEQELKKIKCP